MNFPIKKSRRLSFNFAKDTRGISLLIAMGLIFVLTALSVGVVNLVLSFMQTTKQVEKANAAYFAAEGGVEMALYDLVKFDDGYRNSKSRSDMSVYLGSSSMGEDSWQLFATTLPEDGSIAGERLIPNPYFVGDKDGSLTMPDEWGVMSKGRPLSLSLLIDERGDPAKASETDPAKYFTYFSDGANKKIIFYPGDTWDPSQGVDPDGITGPRGAGDEEMLTWILSAIDGDGDEYTLQGVVWESDFDKNCNGDSTAGECFYLDLSVDADPDVSYGNSLVGEDINRNLSSAVETASGFDRFNRVSGVVEQFRYASPNEFITDMAAAMTDADSLKHLHNIRLTVSLIGTPMESSGTGSNTMRYKLISVDENWADEYTYIVSEGFARTVKQTIETHFKRGSTIPVFSYVIFQ